MNSNGVLTFSDVGFTGHQPRNFPFHSPPLIAPFWYDLDPSAGGNISYRQTNDSTLLQDVHSLLLELNVEDLMDFYPTHLFIATWYQVPAFMAPPWVMNLYRYVKSFQICLFFIMLRHTTLFK